jgi:general stress protein YciG
MLDPQPHDTVAAPRPMAYRTLVPERGRACGGIVDPSRRFGEWCGQSVPTRAKVRTFETFIPAERLSLGYAQFEREMMAAAIEMPKKSSTSSRGFASMDREKQLAIARKGGESVPNEKRSFSQNPRLAAEAGRKGGRSVNPAKRSFSRNHALASEAGRKGGHASHSGPKKPAA